MDFLAVVGAITTTLVGLAAGVLAWHILGNIYGGISGAYRLRTLLWRGADEPPFGHRKAFAMGLRCWMGQRYDGEVGEYYQIGGLEVPLDGRDPIRRSRFYGA